tara:strand:- start:4199 stop:4321 length:123 start_codon:yes stop_codon:yes gene_type:complete
LLEDKLGYHTAYYDMFGERGNSAILANDLRKLATIVENDA